MPQRIKHTVRTVVKKLTSSIGATAARVFPDGPPAKCDVLHLANNHASQIIYVKWVHTGDPEPTITSTNFYEQIPAGESRQFQMENPTGNPDKPLEFWILGSGSSTSYNAVAMKG